MMVQDVIAELKRWKFALNDEKRCQMQIMEALQAKFPNAGIVREVKCSSGYIDFCIGRIGIEVKLKGSPRNIYKQVLDYAEDNALDAIILLTLVNMSLPRELSGKPTYVVPMADAWAM